MTSYSNTNSLIINGIIHSTIEDTKDYVEFYITREYTNQAGEQVVDWYTVRATNGQAERVRSYATGTYVLITGEFFNKKVPGVDKEGNPVERDVLIIKAHKVVSIGEDEAINHGVITGTIASFRTDETGNKVSSYENGDRVSFSVAYNSRVYDEVTKEWSDVVQFFPVTTWWNAGKGASFKYGVGSYVCLNVSLKCNQWNDQDTGALRVATQIQVNRLDARYKSSGGNSNGATGYTPPSQPSVGKTFARPKVKDQAELESIPF